MPAEHCRSPPKGEDMKSGGNPAGAVTRFRLYVAGGDVSGGTVALPCLMVAAQSGAPSEYLET